MEPYLSTQVNNSSPGYIRNSSRQQSSSSPSYGISHNNNEIADKITLSEEGIAQERQASEADRPSQTSEKEALDLSRQELVKLSRLKRRDTEVKNHEQAHLSNAGGYAKGGASFTYQKGPDGALYAIGGEVSIDISSEASPEATITKMQTVRKAALAPLQPSAADRQIAAQASVKEQQARQQLIKEQHEELLSAEQVTEDSTITTGSSTSRSSNNVALLRYADQNPPDATFTALA